MYQGLPGRSARPGNRVVRGRSGCQGNGANQDSPDPKENLERGDCLATSGVSTVLRECLGLKEILDRL